LEFFEGETFLDITWFAVKIESFGGFLEIICFLKGLEEFCF
jgi:hypothetical protein